MTPIVASFENQTQADQATQALRGSGVEPSRAQLNGPPHMERIALRLIPTTSAMLPATELGQALVDLRVPD